MKVTMSALSCWTLRWTPRLILLVGEQCEPAFDLIEPGGAGRGEMEVIARAAGEPRFDGRGLVGGVIIEHEMDVEIGRHGLLDLAEELAEFDRTVTLVAAADDLAGSNVQSGEQRGRAVTLVVMTTPLDLTGAHRQQRLGSVECLDLRFLVDAQHQGSVGWVEVEPDNVAHLIDEQRVRGQLEGLDAMRLQAEGTPDATDARSRDATVSAMLRVLQCVAPRGWLSSVCTMTLSTFASSIVRGAPGRNSSSNPSTPRSTKRRRHLPTVCAVTRSPAATALLLKPEAHPNTIRARNAKACAVLRRRV